MLSEQKTSEEQVTTLVSKAAVSEVDLGNSRFGITIIMVMAGFIGAWGCICLVGGIAGTRNIQELGRGVLTAFTGI